MTDSSSKNAPEEKIKTKKEKIKTKKERIKKEDKIKVKRESWKNKKKNKNQFHSVARKNGKFISSRIWHNKLDTILTYQKINQPKPHPRTATIYRKPEPEPSPAPVAEPPPQVSSSGRGFGGYASTERYEVVFKVVTDTGRFWFVVYPTPNKWIDDYELKGIKDKLNADILDKRKRSGRGDRDNIYTETVKEIIPIVRTDIAFGDKMWFDE